MYATKNYKTKKEFKAAVAEKDVEVYQPNQMFEVKAGPKVICGPHAPAMHTWYANARVIERDGSFYVEKGSKVV